MVEPHHRRTVGYSMIVVSASLFLIALLYLAIGENVLFGDEIQRKNTIEFNKCKETNFASEECKKFEERWEMDQGKKVSVNLEDNVESKLP